MPHRAPFHGFFRTRGYKRSTSSAYGVEPITYKTTFLAAAVLLGTVLAGCAQPAATPMTSNGSSSAASRSGRPLAQGRATKGSFFVGDLDHGDVIMRGDRQETIGPSRPSCARQSLSAREPSGDLVVVNPRKVTAPIGPVDRDALGEAGRSPREARDHVQEVLTAGGCRIGPTPSEHMRPMPALRDAASDDQGSASRFVREFFIDDSIESLRCGSLRQRRAGRAHRRALNIQMTNSEGLAVDASDNIWITNYGAGDTPASVLEFDSNANGNVAPKRSIKGSGTQLNATIGLAIDRENRKDLCLQRWSDISKPVPCSSSRPCKRQRLTGCRVATRNFPDRHRLAELISPQLRLRRVGASIDG